MIVDEAQLDEIADILDRSMASYMAELPADPGKA
jgi:hypothetical protein